MSTSDTQRPSRHQPTASRKTETVLTSTTTVPASGTYTISAANTTITSASGTSTIPAASLTTTPTGNINMLQLATAMMSAGWSKPIFKEHTSITNDFTTIWNLREPKESAALVRASETDDSWKRFNVGTTTATKLLDLFQDKA